MINLIWLLFLITFTLRFFEVTIIYVTIFKLEKERKKVAKMGVKKYILTNNNVITRIEGEKNDRIMI